MSRQRKKRMYVLWKTKLFLCMSLADISSSAALIYASTLSFWNPGNSLLTGFFIRTLILSKLFFAHRIKIASCQPLPFLKTNHIPGLTFFNGFPLFLGWENGLLSRHTAPFIHSLLLLLGAPISPSFMPSKRPSSLPPTHRSLYLKHSSSHFFILLMPLILLIST